MSLLKRIRRKLSPKPKSYLLDNKFEIVPAFELDGEVYYMHKDPMNTLAGRGLTALVFYEELLMRCDIEYLKDHVKATNAIFSNQKVSLTDLLKLNINLEERIKFLAAIPNHVYKMASVVFFTKNESPYIYDFKTGQEKIKKWENTDGMYGFFLQTPLKDLVPCLQLPESNSPAYLEVLEKINKLHLENVHQILFKGTLQTDMKN